MIRATLAEIARVVRAELTAPPAFNPAEAPLPAISIDSRTIEPGQCFVALPGPRFDGHDYFGQALKRGARVLLASRPPEDPGDAAVMLVEDTKDAFQQLARYLRQKWGKPLIAVTGSMGKTTTRTFAASLLSQRYRVFESPGNLNNEYGVPLALTRLAEEDEIGVLELGMNHRGEIRDLCRICLPEMGVITNVAPVHLEFFSGLAEIADAKAELIQWLSDGDQLVFNADDSRVLDRASPYHGRKISFALKTVADVEISSYQLTSLHEMFFDLTFWNSRMGCRVPFAGEHFLYNIAAAVAIALGFGVSEQEIKRGIGELRPLEMRGRVVQAQGQRQETFTLLDDCYNSNPAATQSLLRSLRHLGGFDRKIVALGEMRELGKSAPELHRQVGREVARSGIDWLVTVGEGARCIQEGAGEQGFSSEQMKHFSDSETAADFLFDLVSRGDLLVCKGSRAMRMERIVSRMVERPSREPA